MNKYPDDKMVQLHMVVVVCLKKTTKSEKGGYYQTLYLMSIDQFKNEFTSNKQRAK